MTTNTDDKRPATNGNDRLVLHVEPEAVPGLEKVYVKFNDRVFEIEGSVPVLETAISAALRSYLHINGEKLSF